MPQLQPLQPFKHGVPVHLRHNHVADQHLRLLFLYKLQRFHAVRRHAHHLNAALLPEVLRNHIPQLNIVIRHHHVNCFHTLLQVHPSWL